MLTRIFKNQLSHLNDLQWSSWTLAKNRSWRISLSTRHGCRGHVGGGKRTFKTYHQTKRTHFSDFCRRQPKCKSSFLLGYTFYPWVMNSLNPNLNLYSISSFWAKGWFRNVSTWRKQIDPVFQTHDWNSASNPNGQIDILETRQFSFSIFLRIPTSTLGIPKNFGISRLPISYLFSIQIPHNCRIGVFETRCSKSKFNLR